LVFWPTVVAPLLDDPATALTTRLVWTLYPVLDAVLLALVLRAVLSRRAGTHVGGLLLAGTMCWLFADLAAAELDLVGTGAILADLGWMVGPALLGLATWLAACDPAHRAMLAPRVAEVAPARRFAAWRMVVLVLPLLVPAGLELWTGGADRPLRLAGGTAVLAAFVGARSMVFMRTRDVAEQRLRSSERYFMALAANSADAVLVIDANGRIVNESPHLAALIGWPGASIRGIRAVSAVCAEDAPNVADLYGRTLASPGTVFDGELRLKAVNGSSPWLAVRAVNLLDDPDVQGVVVNFHEITDRKAAEAELVRLAFHDSLTGLANRALFHDRVDHIVDAGAIAATAILFLDLDGFKDVNDAFGHDAGDELLCQVAARLLRSARPGDTVARLGGDEFAILLEQADDPRTAALAVANRILRELTAPVLLSDGLVTLSASVGIAIPDATATASSALRDADVAMYEAKAGGRGRWVEFQPAMRAATVERLQLSHDLCEALEADQLRVVYQPIVRLNTGKIVGFEALLRWDHPTLGCIEPDRFIPLAEESGLIAPIGQWVLDTACRTAAAWQQLHHRPDLTIAVNVSARQLASSDLVSHVEDALNDAGLTAASLVLEMTETVLVDDPGATAGRLRQLRRLGVRLAVDDFGTGYSSLSYLRQFPVDILKIDRSFIAPLTDAGESPLLVHGLLELGRTLGLELVAEGIETATQLTHLRQQGCHLGQGYLFAKPVDAAVAGSLLTTGRFPVMAAPPPGYADLPDGVAGAVAASG
ncbi:MAG: EAL domain-containing protein, partial [Acidimicrobiales bacterium]